MNEQITINGAPSGYRIIDGSSWDRIAEQVGEDIRDDAFRWFYSAWIAHERLKVTWQPYPNLGA